VLIAYMAAQQILLVPALVFASAIAAAHFANFASSTVLAAIFVIFGWHVFEWFGAYQSAYFSESYALSLTLFLIGLPYLIQGPGYSVREALLWFATLGTLATFSIAAKFTLLFAWIIACGFGLAWGRSNHRNLLAISIGAALAAYGICFAALYAMNWRYISWGTILPYWRAYPVQYQVGLATCLLGIIGASYLRNVQLAWLCVALTIGLHLPDLFLSIGGGAYYWFNPAEVVAGMVAVAAMLKALGRFSINIVGAAAALTGIAVAVTIHYMPAKLNTLAISLTALDRLEAAAIPRARSWQAKARAHEVARHLLAPERPSAFHDVSASMVADSADVIARAMVRGMRPETAEAVQSTQLSQAVATIRAAIPSHPAGPFGLYINSDADWFWRDTVDCNGRHFALQALTGLALVRGYPSEAAPCPPLDGYYLDEGDPPLPIGANDEEVCQSARKVGFVAVLRVEKPTQVRWLPCSNNR
jgi:hypothetical protein